MTEYVAPYWFQRKPASREGESSEMRQARAKLFRIITDMQRNAKGHFTRVWEDMEHIYFEPDDSENIILSSLIILANPELEQMFTDAGFLLIEEIPGEDPTGHQREFREKFFMGGNLEKKEH